MLEHGRRVLERIEHLVLDGPAPERAHLAGRERDRDLRRGRCSLPSAARKPGLERGDEARRVRRRAVFDEAGVGGGIFEQIAQGLASMLVAEVLEGGARAVDAVTESIENLVERRIEERAEPLAFCMAP
jgi:hypothetical protein